MKKLLWKSVWLLGWTIKITHLTLKYATFIIPWLEKTQEFLLDLAKKHKEM